jgi:hypothetical protein
MEAPLRWDREWLCAAVCDAGKMTQQDGSITSDER